MKISKHLCSVIMAAMLGGCGSDVLSGTWTNGSIAGESGTTLNQSYTFASGKVTGTTVVSLSGSPLFTITIAGTYTEKTATDVTLTLTSVTAVPPSGAAFTVAPGTNAAGAATFVITLPAALGGTPLPLTTVTDNTFSVSGKTLTMTDTTDTGSTANTYTKS